MPSYLEFVELYLLNVKDAIQEGDAALAYQEAVKLSVAADELCDELNEIKNEKRVISST